MIGLENVTYRFPQFRLGPVTCEFAPGIVAVVGPNGAGKTTLLSILSGLYERFEGTLSIGGRVVAPHEARTLVASNGLSRAWYERLTLRDHEVLFSAGYPSFSRDTFARRALDDGLALDRPLRTFSAGMKMRACVAAAFARDARVLIFDEPWNELDPLARRQFSGELRALAADGSRTIFVSSHDLDLVRSLADVFLFIAAGRVAAYGQLGSIAEEHHVAAGAPSVELYERVVRSCA